MDRSDLFVLAAAHGWVRGTPLSPRQRAEIGSRVRESLTQAELDAAFGQPTADEAIAALLEELT